jgi:hypothetical protein
MIWKAEHCAKMSERISLDVYGQMDFWWGKRIYLTRSSRQEKESDCMIINKNMETERNEKGSFERKMPAIFRETGSQN